MPRWTQAQREAIEARGCNLLVSAAAGSGKTAVLVGRILSLLSEGQPLRSMLMVTFTRAAAAEMRGRIFEALQDAASQGDVRLADQMAWVEHADILTLHGFCTRVLRSHFQAVGVDPAFRVAEADQLHPLRQQAMEEALIDCCETEAETFAALTDCLQPDAIADWAYRLHRFLMARPDPWAWLERAVGALPVEAEQVAESPLVRSLLQDIALDAEAAALRAAQIQAQYGENAAWAKYAAIAAQDEAVCRRYAKAAREGLSALRALCQEAEQTSLWSRLPPAKRGDAGEKEASQRFQKIRDTIKKQFDGLRKDFFPSQSDEAYAEDSRLLQRQLRALALLLKRYDQAFAALKEERNLLDFSDLEQFALAALQDDRVAEALRARYAFIFVDEYQDSSPLQEALLTRIARADNRFMVGDVKQSIYRFRLADPSLFLEKYSTYPVTSGQLDRRIDLNENFRSFPSVLHGVNRVFERILRASVTELDYDEAAALKPGVDFGEAAPPVEIHLIDEASAETGAPEGADASEELPEDQSEEGEEGSLQAIEREAVWIAQRAKELLGMPGTHGAPLRYRDMVILLRATRNRASRMMEILRSQGVSAWTEQAESFYEQLEVAQMLDLLRVIDNPLQDQPLLAALRGPALGLDERALCEIRIQTPRGSMEEAVRQASERKDALGASLRAFLERLERWRFLSRFVSLHTLLHTIYEETGFLAEVGALPGGRGRQANLRLLSESAVRFQNSFLGGLSAFLRHVDRVRQHEDVASAQDIGASDDVVRIMSIHKSKGLQFPVVFLAGLGGRFYKPEAKQPILCHNRLGIGAWAFDAALGTRRETLSFRAITQTLQREQMAEEARVLYVGMTRAEKHLLLYGSIRQPQEAAVAWDHPHSPASIAKAKTLLDWVMPCVLDHPDAEDFRASQGLEIRISEPDDSRWTLSLHPAPEVAAVQAVQTPDALLRDLEHVAVEEATRVRLFEKLSAHTVPYKQTVTERLRDGMLLLEPLATKPQCLQDAPSLGGAERGTALHKVLMQLDLERLRAADALREQLRAQRDIAQARGILTEAEAASVSLDALEAFWSSDLGRRLLASPRVEREYPFNLRTVYQGKDVLLQGVIDCCFLEAGAWVLLDYKSDRAADLEHTLRQYQPQLAYYAEALETITRIPVRERLLYLFSRRQAYAL